MKQRYANCAYVTFDDGTTIMLTLRGAFALLASLSREGWSLE